MQRDDWRRVDAPEPNAFAGRRVPSAWRAAVDIDASRFGDAHDSRAERNHEFETRERNSKLRRRVERRVAGVSLRVHVPRRAFAADRRRFIEREVAVQLLSARANDQERTASGPEP